MQPILPRAATAALIGLAGLTLTACDLPGTPSSGKPAATAQPAPPAPKPQKILAQWQSFSLSPPSYAEETLEVYDDLTCALVTAQGTRQPCQWARAEGGRLNIKFLTSGAQVVGTLQPAQSIAARKQAGTAGYLVVPLDNTRTQSFVLASSPDAPMTRNTVLGELAWSQGRYADAIAILKRSVDAGDPYARLRLGWLLATAPGFQEPELALRLMESFANQDTFAEQSALAAALAANKRFSEAVTVGEKACAKAPADQKADCNARVDLYRAKRPFLLTLAGAPATQPAETAAAAPEVKPEEKPAEKPVEKKTKGRN
jgi:tetratricopeptide (TPR) repeat protein